MVRQPGKFEQLCTQVGLMTLVWAYAENGLAFMLKDIIAKAGLLIPAMSLGHSEIMSPGVPG